MKKQWIISGAILLAIGLLTAWIASNTTWSEIKIPAPLRGEAQTNPFYALQHLVDSLDGSSQWRRVLGAPPPHDEVLVLSYWNWSLIESRRQQIEAWVAAGGRLIIDRTLIGGEHELSNWLGIARAYPKQKKSDVKNDADEDNTSQPERNTLRPLPRSDIGICSKLVVKQHDETSEDLRTGYTVCNLTDRSWLTSTRKPVWALADKNGLQALRVPIGKGSVTVINANPFGNRELSELDHASLFVAATQLHRADRVVFLSEEEHASLLTLIWENGKAVVLLLFALLLAILWRGAVRFGPLGIAPDSARRSLAEQIIGSGLFTLRLGGGKALHAATVRALDEAAQRRIANYTRLSTDLRIAALAKATGVSPEKLADTIHYRGERRAGELRNAIELLEVARRTLIATKN